MFKTLLVTGSMAGSVLGQDVSFADLAHRSAIAAVRDMWNAHAADFHAAIDQSQAIVQTNANSRSLLFTTQQFTACNDAIQAFETTLQTCSAIAALFDGTGGDPTALVNTHCAAGGCHEQVLAALQEVKTKCVETEILQNQCQEITLALNCNSKKQCAVRPSDNTCQPNMEFWEKLRMYLVVPCLRGPDGAGGEKFCVPSFYNFINADPSTPLATRLQNGCDECTLKIFKAWGEIQPFEAGLHFLELRGLCLRAGEPKKFCAVHHAEVEAVKAAAPRCGQNLDAGSCGAGCVWKDGRCDTQFTEQNLGAQCHPCQWAYLRRALFVLNALQDLGVADDTTATNGVARTDIIKGLQALAVVGRAACTTNLQDQFCLPLLQAWNKEDFKTNTCPAIEIFVQDLGCCAGTMMNVLKAQCEAAKLSDPANSCDTVVQILTTTMNMCPTKIPVGCSQAKWKLRGAATIANIKLNYWNSNKAKVIELVRAAIAYNAGLDVDDIKDLSVTASDGNTFQTAADAATMLTLRGRRLLQADELAVSYLVVVESQAESDSVSQGANGDQAPFELQKVPVEGMADPLKGIIMTGGGTTQDVPRTFQVGSASAMGPGLAAAAAALLALL